METTRDRDSMPQEFEEHEELEPTPEDDDFLRDTRDTIEIFEDEIEFE